MNSRIPYTDFQVTIIRPVSPTSCANVSVQQQPIMTLGVAQFVTHNKLCHFNNGVCCGYDSKTKSRPASKTISFKLLPHKNNTLSPM